MLSAEMQEDKGLGGRREREKYPRSKAAETPNDDYGRSQDTSDNRGRDAEGSSQGPCSR